MNCGYLKNAERSKMNLLVFLLIVLFPFVNASATATPRSVGGEDRIKIINYRPNAVFKYVGHYMYQSIIEFELGEEVQTISMGTPTPWQLVASGNRIFLKPVENDATTNMTVITNKRMYFFEMHAEEASGVDDENLAFIIKFVYPENLVHSGGLQHVNAANEGPDLSKPELYNFHYKISGHATAIEPLQVFDDGEFTYLKFRDINAELPAIFLVNEQEEEGLINYKMVGKYVVIERVAPRFTLRYGKRTICVFNEAYDLSQPNLREVNQAKLEGRKSSAKS